MIYEPYLRPKIIFSRKNDKYDAIDARVKNSDIRIIALMLRNMID